MFLGIGVAALAAAAFLGWIGYQLKESELVFLNWPTVSGKITSIDVQEKSKAAVSGKASSASHVYWMVVVTFDYVVGGKTYTGDRLSNSPPMENTDFHDQPSPALKMYSDRYPVGQEVQIHFNPSQPEKSYLEIRTGGAQGFLYFATGSLVLAFIMFGLYFLPLF
jgi:hypothetical protein